MPPRSRVQLLPQAVLEQLEDRLRTSSFSDYQAHADWLADLGFSIGKSALASWATLNKPRIRAASAAWSVKATESALRLADQRIQCLNVAAQIVQPQAPLEDLLALADRLHGWANRL